MMMRGFEHSSAEKATGNMPKLSRRGCQFGDLLSEHAQTKISARTSDVTDTAQIGQPNCDQFQTLRSNCVRQFRYQWWTHETTETQDKNPLRAEGVRLDLLDTKLCNVQPVRMGHRPTGAPVLDR